MMRSLIYPILLIVGIFCISPAHCEESAGQKELMLFEGDVVSVDIYRSEITVKNDIAMTFPISDSTKLMKQAEDIKLSDIVPGNYVDVSYYKDAAGSLRVTDVTVEYDETE